MSLAAEEIDNTSRPKILRKKIGRKTTLKWLQFGERIGGGGISWNGNFGDAWRQPSSTYHGSVPATDQIGG